MKLGTNFYFPVKNLVVLWAVLGWGLVCLGSFSAVVILFDAIHLKTKIVSLNEEWMRKSQLPPAKVSAPGLPSAKELEGLKERLRQLNSLEAGQGSSAGALLARLEKILPLDTRFLNLQYDRQNGHVQFSAESTNLDSVSTLLSALEKDEDFSQVNLNHQSAGSAGTKVQFSVDMVNR